MSRFCIYVVVVGGAAALAAFVRSLRRGRADPFADPGRALAREGKHEEACEMFAKALELNPRHERAWGQLGIDSGEPPSCAMLSCCQSRLQG